MLVVKVKAEKEKMAEFFGPEHVDQTIRQAIQWC
jgi:hypothetical protein